MDVSIYQYPEIFRAVHMEASGDIAAEVRFMRRIWARHARRPIRRVLDVASGDSPHGRILSRAGIRVTAVDRSPTMIAAGRRGRGSQAAVRFYRRSIEHFSLPERGFDAAFFMSETFPVLVSNRDVLSHLRSVARVLKRGALYCIDVDRHDAEWPLSGRKLWRRREIRVGTLRVKVREYRLPMRWWEGGWIYELHCRIDFPQGPVRTRDLIPVRYTVPGSLELAARASGLFKPVNNYADLSFTTPMEHCYGRWWSVLRRV